MKKYLCLYALQKLFARSAGLAVLCVFPLLSPLAVAKKDICPAINCDCDSLQNDVWQRACSAHELTIKENCKANQNVPRDFCAIHGPAATPLPLLTELSDVTVLPKSELALSSRKIASIYWSIKSDIKVATVELSQARYGIASNILKSVELNVNTLFDIQRAVALSAATYGNDKRAKKKWRNYGEDSAGAEKDIAKVLKAWRNNFENAKDSDAKTAYRLSILKLYRIQGYLAEQAALAYGYSGSHSKSAKRWSIASKNSMSLLAFSESVDSKSKYIDYFRYQAAARLQRASYQWRLADKISKANEALELSRPYEDEPDVIEVWLLDETEGESEQQDTGFPFRR